MRTLTCLLAAVGLALVPGCGTQSTPNRPITTGETVREDVVKVTEAEREIDRLRAEIAAQAVAGTEIAVGAIQFDVAADVFGTATPIDNRLFYVAVKDAAGNVSGKFSYTQSHSGSTFRYRGSISCLHLYDFDGGTGNRAKLGGPIEWTDSANVPPDPYMWWQQIDNHSSPGRPADKSTLGGIGDEAANEAFCSNPAEPRFGPFEVDKGDIVVRSFGGLAVR
jgi:hypothetical protein